MRCYYTNIHLIPVLHESHLSFCFQWLKYNRFAFLFFIIIIVFYSASPPPTTIIAIVSINIENESSKILLLFLFHCKNVCIDPVNVVDTNENKGWHLKVRSKLQFILTVVRENVDIIFGPAITIVPQSFCLPQLIVSSTMGCRQFSDGAVRYSLLISFIASFTPQLTGFFLYVKSSSIYYARFRSTSIGKKVMLLCHWNAKRQLSYSKTCRDVLSNTIKMEKSLITENIR
jgi:hypothetical protein